MTTTTKKPIVPLAPLADLDGEMAAAAEAKFGRSFEAAVDKLTADVAAAGVRGDAFVASLWADVDGLTEWADAELGPRPNARGWVPQVPDEAERDHALAEMVRRSGPGTVDLWAETQDQPATVAAVEAYYANEDDDTTALPASYLRKVADHFRAWLRPRPESLTSPGEVS